MYVCSLVDVGLMKVLVLVYIHRFVHILCVCVCVCVCVCDLVSLCVSLLCEYDDSGSCEITLDLCCLAWQYVRVCVCVCAYV